MITPFRKRILAILMLGTGVFAVAALAQTSPDFPPPPNMSSEGTLSFEELEQQIARKDLYITKMEVRDLLVKVEGFDPAHRKVKLYIDRRTGEVLSREYKRAKHGKHGKHSKHGKHGGHGKHGPMMPCYPPPQDRPNR